MKKSLLEIYALAVCFVTIICFAVSLGIGIYDVLEMSVSKFTLKSRDFERHKTNEAFTRGWKEEKRESKQSKRVTKRDEESEEQEQEGGKMAFSGGCSPESASSGQPGRLAT